MNCAACGTRMVQRSSSARPSFHYKASGLSNVFLRGIAVCVCPRCKAEAPIIPRVGELHRVIADILSRKPAPLSGEEIRFLRKNMGIPARKLAAVLGIAPETLSRVENGKLPLHPGLERLVRLMGRTSPGGENVREAVLELAEAIEPVAGGRKARPIQLRPDRKHGWRAAA